MDIIKDLKAAAYDAMVQIKLWQDKLNDHNKNIEAHQVASVIPSEGATPAPSPIEPVISDESAATA